MVYSIFKELCLCSTADYKTTVGILRHMGPLSASGYGSTDLVSCQISCLPLYCLGKLKRRGFCMCICQCRILNACLS